MGNLIIRCGRVMTQLGAALTFLMAASKGEPRVWPHFRINMYICCVHNREGVTGWSGPACRYPFLWTDRVVPPRIASEKRTRFCFGLSISNGARRVLRVGSQCGMPWERILSWSVVFGWWGMGKCQYVARRALRGTEFASLSREELDAALGPIFPNTKVLIDGSGTVLMADARTATSECGWSFEAQVGALRGVIASSVIRSQP